MSYLYGRDFSHWSKVEDVWDACRDSKTAFVFLKASEGRSYRDPKAAEYAAIAKKEGVNVLGLYHYCRPDLNRNAAVEAFNYVNTVKSVLEASGWKSCICAIDWEQKSVGTEDWLEDFIDALSEYGINNPVIYCSQSAVRKVGKYVDTDKCGLWVAQWNGKEGVIGDYKPWTVWAFHQYTSNGGDFNVFNGSISQLMKYDNAWIDSDTEEVDCGCECACCKAGKCR